MNMKINKLLGIIVGTGIAVLPQVTMATEGYFSHGWGARHSALGGAGVASITDASGQAINPAGLVSVEDDQLNIAVSLFNPNRQYTAGGGAGFPTNGTHESDSNYFIVPNIAYSSRIDANSAWGVTMYGNGGMNTDYPSTDRAAPDCFMAGGAGTYCAGPAGVDMSQAFISVSYAAKVGNISYGIAPIFVFHAFEARGLAAFGDPRPGEINFSSDYTSLTNHDHDTSTGFGVKLGLQVDLGDGFIIAANYQPKINMSEFEDYSGLFADNGDFDIPSNWVIGLAFEPSDDVKVLLDYKRINYTDSGAVGNPGDYAAFGIQPVDPMLPPSPTNPMVATNQLGMAGGPGFGWDDISVIKFGVEWQQSKDMTWRFGYANNDNPVSSEDVTLNILAPGVVTTHYTAGFKMAMADKGALEFYIVYVPSESVSGDSMSNPLVDMMFSQMQGMPVDAPDQTISIEMDQLIVGASWTIAFGD